MWRYHNPVELAFSGERGKNYIGTRERFESLSEAAVADTAAAR